MKLGGLLAMQKGMGGGSATSARTIFIQNVGGMLDYPCKDSVLSRYLFLEVSF